jgi:hypothetical protein
MKFIKWLYKVYWVTVVCCFHNKYLQGSKLFYISIAVGCMFNCLALTRGQTLTWDQTIGLGNLNKTGLGCLDSTNYQYEVIGLGGTTLRVGPYGFTSEVAQNVFNPSGTSYYPYLEYQYWWDNKSHRQDPFSIFGGYTTTYHGYEIPSDGKITSFNHHLDISTGTLSIDLGINVNGTTFFSHRTEFVTPSGIWVIQITDSGAPEPFMLQINNSVDLVDGNTYSFSVAPKTNGMVITGTSPNASTAVLAIAWKGAVVVDTTGGYTVKGQVANDTLTFFIALASSYAPNSISPINEAWALAKAAQVAGYTNQLQITQNWWNTYWGRHQVDLPNTEETLAKWYARSLYYHGVYFGNTDIPTGLWGTSPSPGGGAICPEYDLVFSQLAMLYTNHVAESANIVDWVKATLPQAEKNALSTTLYNISTSHAWGAQFGLWVGYDGKYILPGTAPEAIGLYEDDASGSCAVMTVKHADFTLDPVYSAFADTVLRQTTKVETDDQVWNGSNYVEENLPSIENQAACLFGMSESVAQGLADSAWTAMLPHVLLPEAIWTNSQGRRYPVLIGSAGGTASPTAGDAPQLEPLWWYGIIQKNDPLISPTFQLISLSNTAAYVFNRGTMSVIASKLYDAIDAYKWALSLTASDVTYDDATIGEMVHDAYDFQRTPETAAHGALICSVVQMLVDPDNNDPIEVFPAIPTSWWTSGVSFKKILVKGGIDVSGSINANNISINLANANSMSKKVNLRVWLPPGTTSLNQFPIGTVVTNGYATLSDTIVGNNSTSYNFVFPVTSVKNENNLINFSLSQNYPNPFNPSTIIKYSVPISGVVTLKVYNSLGQEIATLVNQEQNAGNYNITFDASKLASGVYMYRIQSGDFSLTKKMTLLK